MKAHRRSLPEIESAMRRQVSLSEMLALADMLSTSGLPEVRAIAEACLDRVLLRRLRRRKGQGECTAKTKPQRGVRS